MKRKRRNGELICVCSAYRFPHRMTGGRCNGGSFIADYFERQRYGDCRTCSLHNGTICEVLDGRETVHECPALADFVRYHGIRLYGVNAPPKALRPGVFAFRRGPP